MKRVFAFLLSLVLIIPGVALSDAITADIFLSSNTIVKQYHEISRNSAVKVITPRGHGSGVYIKIDRNFYVLTAKHVVRETNVVAVQGGLEVVVGEVVHRASSQDIALVKIPALQQKKHAKIKPANVGDLEIGTELVYSGYPSGYDLLTSGASVAGIEIDHGTYILQGFAWPGSSGCGVIDASGKVRGVVVGVGVEIFRDNPQLLETVVWMEPIKSSTWREIQDSLKL